VLIDHGESFTQERTCKQDQTRDWVHTVGSTEVYVRSENRVIDEQETQTAIGTGQNWVHRQSIGKRIRGLAYGNGVFVATTDRVRVALPDVWEAEIWTSPDGETWTHAQTFDSTVASVTYGDGLFVAGLQDSTVWTSANGETWTQQQAIGDDSQVMSLAYGNGVFVAGVQDGNVWTSPDGETWTQRQNLGSWVRTMTYANGLFVVGVASNIWTSPDGETWTQQESLGGAVVSLTYGNGLLVAGTQGGGRIWASPDAENWTEQQDLSGGSFVSVEALSYGDGQFVALAGVANDYSVSWHSTDGEIWVQRHAFGDQVGAITHAEGMFVAGSFDSDIWTLSTV